MPRKLIHAEQRELVALAKQRELVLNNPNKLNNINNDDNNKGATFE